MIGRYSGRFLACDSVCYCSSVFIVSFLSLNISAIVAGGTVGGTCFSVFLYGIA